MPPWKPRARATASSRTSGGCSDRELTRCSDWIAGGAPEGDRSPTCRRPPTVATPDWQLGTPDLVVTMPDAVHRAGGRSRHVPHVRHADSDDRRRDTSARSSSAGQRAGCPSREPRHRSHTIVAAARRARPRARVRRRHGTRRAVSRRPAARMDAGPGAARVPDGTQWRLEPGSDLVVQLHLQPTGKPEDVQVSAGFYFTDDAAGAHADRPAARQRNDRHSAPATPQYVVSDRYRCRSTCDVLAVQPHAHNLARRMEATATLPDGATPLADRDRRLGFPLAGRLPVPQPIALPRGTTIDDGYVYDNSRGEPAQPALVRRRASSGGRTRRTRWATCGCRCSAIAGRLTRC